MEKIKAALAKAKTSRKPLVESQKIEAKVTEKKVSADISKIKYTTTKVVTLNAEHLEKNRIISYLTHNVNSSSIDSLRTQVLQKMDENNWQSIAVVSPTANSGKTLVSINLAMSIARQPQKTSILVDFDLRKPKVAAYLGINVEKSLNQYFDNNTSLEDVLVNPAIQKLVIAPTMQPISLAAEALASSKVDNMISELKERYDSRVVIYDLPPILSVDDAMIVIPRVDCVLMVVANGECSPTEIEDAYHLIPKDKLLGVVYNKAADDARSYYY